MLYYMVKPYLNYIFASHDDKLFKSCLFAVNNIQINSF